MLGIKLFSRCKVVKIACEGCGQEIKPKADWPAKWCSYRCKLISAMKRNEKAA